MFHLLHHNYQFYLYLQDVLKGLKQTQDVNHLFLLNHEQRRGAGCVISLYTSLGQESHNSAPGRPLHHTTQRHHHGVPAAVTGGGEQGHAALLQQSLNNKIIPNGQMARIHIPSAKILKYNTPKSNKFILHCEYEQKKRIMYIYKLCFYFSYLAPVGAAPEESNHIVDL